jgi:hypothetical protein
MMALVDRVKSGLDVYWMTEGKAREIRYIFHVAPSKALNCLACC